METYNGWKNRETWNVALWLGKDEVLYQSAVAWVEGMEENGGRISAKDVKEYITVEVWPSGVTPDNCSLRPVVWGEIAACIKEMSK